MLSLVEIRYSYWPYSLVPYEESFKLFNFRHSYKSLIVYLLCSLTLYLGTNRLIALNHIVFNWAAIVQSSSCTEFPVTVHEYTYFMHYKNLVHRIHWYYKMHWVKCITNHLLLFYSDFMSQIGDSGFKYVPRVFQERLNIELRNN